MPESKATKKMKLWKKRKSDWIPRILIGGAAGFGGSLVSAVSEMNKFPPDPVDFKLGALVVMLGWCLAAGVAFGATRGLCNWKYSEAEDEHIRESEPRLAR